MDLLYLSCLLYDDKSVVGQASLAQTLGELFVAVLKLLICSLFVRGADERFDDGGNQECVYQPCS
jgi:hypothetical protein